MRPVPYILLFLLILCFATELSAQWQRLPGPTTGGPRCWDITPDGVIYAGATGGIFRSDDDGRHWELLPGSAEFGQHLWQLNWDNGNLYLLTQNFSANARTFWKSSDEGAHWIVLRTDLFDPHSFTSVFDVYNDTIVVNTHAIGYHSVDGGQSWRESANTGLWNITRTEQGWFSTFYSTIYRWSREWPWSVSYTGSDQTLFPTRLLAAGDYLFMCLNGAGNQFKYTTNGGTTWEDAYFPEPYSYQAISFDARHDTVFVQIGLNLYFSTDGLQFWEPLPSPGMNGTVRACLFTPTGALVAITDEGILRAPHPGAAFVPTSGFSNPNVLSILPASGGRWWIGLDKGLFFSPDNGANWQQIPLSVSDNNPEIRWIRRSGNGMVAAGPTRLFYSPDGGGHWRERSLPGTNLSDISIVGQRLFIVTCELAWYSDNWGVNWQAYLPDTGVLPCHRMFAENDSLLVHAAQWSSVYLSRDTGAHWLNFSQGLGGLPYTTVEMALAPDALYIVSGYRLMRSPLSGPAWQEIPLPLPVSDLDGPLPRHFHFSEQQIRVGIPRVGVYNWDPVAQQWSSFAPVKQYTGSNSFIFSDSLSAMACRGGVWYLGNISLEQVGGLIYVDVNQNDTFDLGDTPLPGYLVEMEGQRAYVASNTDGHYAFDWRGQPDSLRLTPFATGIAVKPERHRIQQSGLQYNFAVAADAFGADLALDITSTGPPRPGFPFELVLSCRNDGTRAARAHLRFQKDHLLPWISFSELPNLIVGDAAEWLLPDIQPGATHRIRVQFRLPLEVPLGTLLYFSGQIETINLPDLDGSDNRQSYVLQVVGSFDPNDKTVTPAGNISPAMVASTQTLTYTIRFQNTGTYPAEFVRITDLLSSGLELGSLRVLASSHPCRWSLQGHLLEFFFPDIWLPDSTNNEPESHGFVKFSITLRPDLRKGEAVSNTADIFFDFNAPVRTNTVQTLIQESLQTTSTAPVLRVRVSPNPASQHWQVDWQETGPARLELFDAAGRLCWSGAAQSGQALVPAVALPAAAYRLLVAAGNKTGEVILIKH